MSDTGKMQRARPNQSRVPRPSPISGRKAPSRNSPHVKENIYAHYCFPNKSIVSIKTSEKKVAIGELEWLILSKGPERTESIWLTITLSFCLSLLFSSICLIGTATFQQNGRVLWWPLLATVAHAAGCVAFGLLSVYFWHKRRSTEQDPIYKLLKKRLDHRFTVHRRKSSRQLENS
ncbi:hypothetical protein ES703_30606 [subsurface metagenome]